MCNVLDYGAVADNSTDLGPALTDAFKACIDGGLVYIPSGNYLLKRWVTLSGGSAWALQLDGIIYRGGTAGGNMIYIEHASDTGPPKQQPVVTASLSPTSRSQAGPAPKPTGPPGVPYG